MPISWATLLTVCLGYFMGSWAMGPIAAILPTISRELDVSVTVVGWTMNVYFLMLVGLLLVMGRLGDLYGHGRVFGLGIAIFTVGLTVCAVSTSFPMLLVARAIQGVGSAMIFGTSLAIVTTAIPRTGRGKAIGFLTMASAASSLSGVWISTWSAEHLNWHWAFVIPVPVGIAGTFIGLRLRLPRAQMTSRRIDWAGAVLLFATLTSATLALNHLHEGGETFEAGAAYHVGMHLLTLALLVVFIKVEQRAEAPLLGFQLLRNSTFCSAVSGNGIAHMSMLATSFLIPFLLERGRGLTPSDTGRLVMTQQVSMVVCALTLGYLFDRCRSPLFAAGMMASISCGLLTLGLVGGSLPYAGLVGIAVILGAGLGGFTTVNNTAVMSMAPNTQLGFASGLVETTRQFGHSIGVSLSSSFMGAALAEALAPTPEQYASGFQQAAFAMGLVAFGGVLALLWPRLQEARVSLSGQAGTVGAELTGRAPRVAAVGE